MLSSYGKGSSPEAVSLVSGWYFHRALDDQTGRKESGRRETAGGRAKQDRWHQRPQRASWQGRRLQLGTPVGEAAREELSPCAVCGRSHGNSWGKRHRSTLGSSRAGALRKTSRSPSRLALLERPTKVKQEVMVIDSDRESSDPCQKEQHRSRSRGVAEALADAVAARRKKKVKEEEKKKSRSRSS